MIIEEAEEQTSPFLVILAQHGVYQALILLLPIVQTMAAATLLL